MVHLEFLIERFPMQCIGRRGPVEWPTRLTDLTPVDLFLWGHLKSKAYSTKAINLEELQKILFWNAVC